MKLGRSILSFVAIVIAFTFYGFVKEHDDANVAGMYGLIAIIPAAIITILSYLLYHIAQLKSAYISRYLKDCVHLILAVGLIWLNPKEAVFVILVFALVIILAVNLIAELIEVK